MGSASDWLNENLEPVGNKNCLPTAIMILAAGAGAAYWAVSSAVAFIR